MRLTDLLIKSLKAPETGQKSFFDDTLPGFGVRVSQGGSKSFIVMYGEKRRLRTLDRYPDIALADARKLAKQMHGEVLSQTPETANAPTLIPFEAARDRFLDDCKLRTKPSTFEEYHRLLNKHFDLARPLKEITRQDVMECVAKLSGKPSIEQHAFVAIRTMMNWCVRQGLLDVSPVPPLRFKTELRSRVLSDIELRMVWGRAEAIGYPFGTIVQLLIMTGQRRGEIAALRRSWIDEGEIVFPRGFTKNKREHHLPLGARTMDIINRIDGETDLLFPARGTMDTPFNGWSKTKRSFDQPLQIAPYTLHDLRRTNSSNLARLGVPVHVTERLLNHVSGTVSGIAAVYNRHTYAEEMRAAVTAYEAHIAKLIEA